MFLYLIYSIEENILILNEMKETDIEKKRDDYKDMNIVIKHIEAV